MKYSVGNSTYIHQKKSMMEEFSVCALSLRMFKIRLTGDRRSSGLANPDLGLLGKWPLKQVFVCVGVMYCLVHPSIFEVSCCLLPLLGHRQAFCFVSDKYKPSRYSGQLCLAILILQLSPLLIFAVSVCIST